MFIFLDSGNGTHGKRQLEWLEEKLSHRKDYRHCFVVSHNWLFRTSYNYTTTPKPSYLVLTVGEKVTYEYEELDMD